MLVATSLRAIALLLSSWHLAEALKAADVAEIGKPRPLHMRRQHLGNSSMPKSEESLTMTMDRLLRQTGECQLCGGKQDWAFILGTGRSGSTTALEMINAIPGFYMAGENYGVMNTLLELYNAKTTVKPTSKNHILCALQQFARTIIGEYDVEKMNVVGFKEIRHVQDDQLEFLEEVFPCGRFVVNTRRNLGKQHNSEFQKDILMSDLVNWTSTLESWLGRNPEKAFRLTLEDYSPELFTQLLRFLGVEGCNFNEVAHANNGYNWNDDSEKSKKALVGDCVFRTWKN